MHTVGPLISKSPSWSVLPPKMPEKSLGVLWDLPEEPMVS